MLCVACACVCCVHGYRLAAVLTGGFSLQFKFDRVFGDGASNEDVYRNTVAPFLRGTFLGGKVTCFAYGQTG